MAIQIECQQCGVQFSTKDSDTSRKFCGHACYRAHESVHGRPNQAVERTEFSCKQCGNSFFRNPGELRSYRKKFGKDPLYCSMECSALGRRYSDDSWHKNCVNCGKLMTLPRRPGGTIYRGKIVCSSECRRAWHSTKLLEFHADRVPEPFVGRHGYLRMTVRKDPNKKAVAVLQHRYVMEQHIGRDLRSDETVHHINGIRTDNRLENLELFSSRHGPGQRVVDKVAFAIEMLTLYPEFAREAGYELRAIPREPIERLFAEDGADVVHRPNVSAT